MGQEINETYVNVYTSSRLCRLWRSHNTQQSRSAQIGARVGAGTGRSGSLCNYISISCEIGRVQAMTCRHSLIASFEEVGLQKNGIMCAFSDITRSVFSARFA
jgi:hypothetical protein